MKSSWCAFSNLFLSLIWKTAFVITSTAFILEGLVDNLYDITQALGRSSVVAILWVLWFERSARFFREELKIIKALWQDLLWLLFCYQQLV